MPYCPLCRVENTEEHAKSAWCAYNKTLQAQGKMPLQEENFNKFEKHKFTGSSVSPTAQACAVQAVQQTTTKNVRNWHWEEEKLTDWAKERITTLLVEEAKIPVDGNGSISITELKDFKPDAFLNLRKGKVFFGFEIKAKIIWKGEIKDSDGNSCVKCEGECSINDLSDDVEEDEFEDYIGGFKATSKEKGQEAILKVMKKRGRDAIVKQMLKWREEIVAKAAEKQKSLA